MHDYHMTEDQAMETPLIRAFAYRAWSIENNPWGGVERATDGYVAQELEARKRI